MPPPPKEAAGRRRIRADWRSAGPGRDGAGRARDGCGSTTRPAEGRVAGPGIGRAAVAGGWPAVSSSALPPAEGGGEGVRAAVGSLLPGPAWPAGVAAAEARATHDAIPPRTRRRPTRPGERRLRNPPSAAAGDPGMRRRECFWYGLVARRGGKRAAVASQAKPGAGRRAQQGPRPARGGPFKGSQAATAASRQGCDGRLRCP